MLLLKNGQILEQGVLVQKDLLIDGKKSFKFLIRLKMLKQKF